MKNFNTEFKHSLEQADGPTIAFSLNKPIEEYSGRSNVLFFNYGLVCSNAHFKDQLKHFEQKGYYIIIHDYRFHYESSTTNNIEDCSFKNIASDVFALANHIGITSAHFIGHSMGVNICLEVAKTYPQIVEKLVLISGTVLPPQDIMFDSNVIEIILPYVEKIKDKFPKAATFFWEHLDQAPLIKEQVRKGGFNPSRVSIDLIELYLKKITELPIDLFLQLFKEMHKHDIIGDLENIENQALIIGGDKDKVIPNYLQNILIKNLKNSKLYIVKDGSHVPQWDFPETINRRIEHFIRA